MIGGGKAGNIISPNPNTIATAEAFQIDLTSLMMKNILPAIGALLVTIVLATFLTKRSDDMISENDLEKAEHKKLPSFTAAIAGPLLVILLLALRPLFQIAIDPLIALPAGGILCMLATGQIKNIKSYAEFGLSKVIGVSILLIGTGTLAGIIKASNLQFDMISVLEAGNPSCLPVSPDFRYPDGRCYRLHNCRCYHRFTDFRIHTDIQWCRCRICRCNGSQWCYRH